MDQKTSNLISFTKKVILSSEESLKYLEMLQKFEKLYKQCVQQFSQSQEDTYHLLSTKFIKEWKQFCQSTAEQRSLPMPYNQDMLEPQTNYLKAGLIEHDDYEIVTVDVMKLFSQFKGTYIIRRSRKVNGEKKVKIYLQKFKYLNLSMQTLRKIIDNKINAQNIKQYFKTIQYSQQQSIKEFISFLANHQKLGYYRVARLWLASTPFDKLIQQIKSKTIKHTGLWMDIKIKGIAKELQNDLKINQLNIAQDDYFILQVKDRSKQWFLYSQTTDRCEGCHQYKEIKSICACKKASYCTQSCKQKDRSFHKRRCTVKDQQMLNEKISMVITPSSMKGLTGLTNLGNTCFMNSCLQCLSNTIPLTQYFLNSSYQPQINKVNPIGTKGKLARTYAKFIRSMWCDQQGIFSPYLLKSAVGSINPLFQGYSQQDSQQFFSFIVDGLHEDLNRVKKKPIIQQIQSNSRQDKIVAQQSWIAHTKRNQSIITDIMTGQYRSKVTCPDCHKDSITFDPFITVTVPIAQQKTHKIEFYLIYNNFHMVSQQKSIKYSKLNLQQWLAKAEAQTNIIKKFITFYILTKKENIYKVGQVPFSEIIHKVQSQSHHLFLLERTLEQIQLKDPIQITVSFTKENVYESIENLWFKFPIIMQKSNFTGLNTYKRLLKLIYYQAYDNSSKYQHNQKQQDYQEKMLENRPFKLYIKYQKVTHVIYNGIQTSFKQKMQFTDENSIDKILQNIQITDMEIQARFSKQGIRNFSMNNLNDLKKHINSFTNINKYKESQDAQTTLQQCLDTLREPEKLDVGNQWYCPHCKKHKRAEKQLSIYKAPKILIIHLKRFKQKGYNRKQKNQAKVLFPHIMNFSPYLCDPTPMQSYNEIIKEKEIYIQPSYQLPTTPQKANYQLYAVSNHYGGLGGGHYTAYAKNNGKWYDFNDSSVRKCSQSSICSSAAYLLFYQRKQAGNSNGQ